MRLCTLSIFSILMALMSSSAIAKEKITTIVDIRDALFFDTALGAHINTTYYTYSPLATGAITPGKQTIAATMPAGTPLIDRGKGLRFLGGWGLYSLMGFFKALSILALILFFLIAGALGRRWPLMIPPLLLLGLLLSYKPAYTITPSLKTAVKNKDPEALRQAFLHRTKRLHLSADVQKSALPWIRELCQSSSIKNRFYGVAVAGDLQLRDLRPLLIKLAKTDPVMNVRYISIEALSKFPRSTDILKGLALNAPSLYEKYYVLDALLRRNISWTDIAKRTKTPKVVAP